jgi:hypothetical protein
MYFLWLEPAPPLKNNLENFNAKIKIKVDQSVEWKFVKVG